MNILLFILLFTGHLHIVPHYQITNLVDDNGKIITEINRELEYYTVEINLTRERGPLK
jgi:hypothetical protein